MGLSKVQFFLDEILSTISASQYVNLELTLDNKWVHISELLQWVKLILSRAIVFSKVVIFRNNTLFSYLADSFDTITI